MENNSRLNQLLQSSVKLSEVIAQETEEKTAGLQNIAQTVVEKTTDFAPEPVKQLLQPEEPEEEEEPYDAEANARSLVGGLLGIDTAIFSVVGVIKTRKSIGGKETLAKMKHAYAKSASGKTLNEEEQRLLQAFEVYKNDMAMLEQDYIPNQKRIEMLVQLAIPYCEESKVKVGPGMAFWASYTGYTVERVAKLMMR